MREKELKELDAALNYYEVAENLHAGLMMYFEHQVRPGRFLTACLENDLTNALGYASTKTWDYVFNVMNFLYSNAPGGSWGSKENVKNWTEKNATGLRSAFKDFLLQKANIDKIL